MKEVLLREKAGLMQGMDETLGLQDVGRAEITQELAARRRAAEAALHRLDEMEEGSTLPAEQREWLRQQYQNRIDRLEEYEGMLANAPGEGSPEFRQLALDLNRFVVADQQPHGAVYDDHRPCRASLSATLAPVLRTELA